MDFAETNWADYGDVRLLKNYLHVFKVGNDYNMICDILELACRRGFLNIVKYIIEVYKIEDYHRTHFNRCFYFACMSDRENIVRYLSSIYRIDSHFEEIDSEQGFRLACKHGSINVLRYLIDLHYFDNMYCPLNLNIYQTAMCDTLRNLRQAIKCGHFNVIEYITLLCQTKPQYYKAIKINTHNEILYTTACEYGQIDIVKHLTTLYKIDKRYRRINIHVNNECGFIKACREGHTDVVMYLCELFMNDKKYNKINNISKGFHIACSKGRFKIVKYLLSLYKKFNIIDSDPFTLAKKQVRYHMIYIDDTKIGDHYIIIKYLTKLYKIDNKYQPLYINYIFENACVKHNIKLVKYLILLCKKDKNYQPINMYNKNLIRLIETSYQPSYYLREQYSDINFVKFVISCGYFDNRIKIVNLI